MTETSLDVRNIKNIESEAGIVASLVYHPEFAFYSEQLRPNHFTNSQNAYIYYAICGLANKGIEKIDAYNITNYLNSNASTKEQTQVLTIQALNEFIELARNICRNTPEEYLLLVDNVLDAAFRRNTFNKLVECENLCFNSTEENIEEKIYSALDSVMMDFSVTNDSPMYKDVVEDLWKEVEDRQSGGTSGIPFKFDALNSYASIERGELFLFGAYAKQGKSMMLLNCAVDLMLKNQAVLYIDSELNSRMFTCRLISCITGIEHSRLKNGNYNEVEKQKIDKAIKWLKTRNFTHIYMPIFDAKSIYTTVKRIKHSTGLDVLIVDYFKSNGDGDAFNTYQELGRVVDMVNFRQFG